MGQKTIWLIRHGESEANAGFATTDPVEVRLTEKGKRQAKMIAAQFRRPPALIITSAYVRTKQTAGPTMRRYPQVPCEVWPVHEFTYLVSLHGIESTVHERRPLVDAFWNRFDPMYRDGERGESFVHFMQRVQQVIKQLQHRSEDFIVVFSHEQFIQALCLLLPDYNRPISPSTPPFDHSFKASETNMKYFRWLLKNLRMGNGDIVKKELYNSFEPPHPEHRQEFVHL